MKVIGLDERVHNWKLTGYMPLKSDTRPRSSGHRRARALLLELFPMESILEEVFLPGCNQSLYVDFFIPNHKLGVEVHGHQHFKFVAHFHTNMLGFLESKKRDNKKADWFSINGLELIVLPDSESDDEWKRRFNQRPAKTNE